MIYNMISIILGGIFNIDYITVLDIMKSFMSRYHYYPGNMEYSEVIYLVTDKEN